MSAPFSELVPVCAVVAAACWVLSITTREYSWVDRIWSIAPPCYVGWIDSRRIHRPAAVCRARARHRVPLAPADLALAVVFGMFLLGETNADQQQWDSHRRKAGLAASGEPTRGFLDTGLFRLQPTPHYFCEMAMWWTVYGFAVVASGQWLHWTIAGPLLLTMLFQGTSRFTESLSLAKYPQYTEYQRTTSRLVPWWPRPATDSGH